MLPAWTKGCRHCAATNNKIINRCRRTFDLTYLSPRCHFPGLKFLSRVDGHRYFCVDVEVSTLSAGNYERKYQQKARNLLRQVKEKRIQSRLVTQKVEELLLLFVSEYDNNIPSDGSLALKLLNTALSNCSSQKDEPLLPRLFSLTSQVMIRCELDGSVNVKQAHFQIVQLLTNHQAYFSNDLRYNTHHVNDACSYYIRHIVAEANKGKKRLDYVQSEQLHRLIDRLAELYRNPTVRLVANPMIDDAVIMLLCNEHKPREAHNLLRRRVEQSLSSQLSFKPLVSSFTTIINGYAKTYQPENALQIVQWMLSTHPINSAQIPPPNVSCFNALLHAYAMAGGEDAGFKSEQTLEWMEHICESDRLDVKPNSTSYNTCINAWARSNHPEAPIRAENILWHLVDLGESGSQIQPSENAFTSVMNAWVNCINTKTAMNEDIIDRILKILNLMESFSADNDRLTLSVVPYSVLIKAWEKTAQQRKGSEKERCGDKILQVLLRMRAKNIAPTTEMYNSILTALGEIKAINAVFFFFELEQQLHDGTIQLNTRTFNCGLNAIAALNRPDAVQKATGILTRMFEYNESYPNIFPSTLTFNIILKVLSRSTSHVLDAAIKADDLLTQMEDTSSLKPDFISYVTCIMAWGRSCEEDKMTRIVNLLHRFKKQKDSTCNSRIAVFNAVLSVCHHNLSHDILIESLQTAEVTMTELRKLEGDVVADQITYSSFFKVVKEGLLVDYSNKHNSFLDLVENEFIRCSRDGYVTRDILTTVFHAVPTTVSANLVGQNEDPRTFLIPKNWSRKTK